MEIPSINDVDRYLRAYGELGAALAVSGSTPAPGETEFLRIVTSPGRFDFGMLPPPDIFFAAAVTSILHPRLAVEIGTASGSSAAIIGKMIALRETQNGRITSGPLVHTIDKNAQYVLDHAKPAGFAIDQMAPELRDRIVVHAPQDSSVCRQLVREGDLKFAFIDGNHRHPWPLVDMLQILPSMKDGWILLHDVDLPGLTARAVAAGQQVEHVPVHGAKYVFDFWPHEKIRAGNIGIIQIPSDRRSLGTLVAKLRELPGEVSPGSWSKHWRLIDSLVKSSTPPRWFSRRLWPAKKNP